MKRYIKIIAGIAFIAIVGAGVVYAAFPTAVGNYFDRGQMGARDTLIVNDKMEAKTGSTVTVEAGALFTAEAGSSVVFNNTVTMSSMAIADLDVSGTLDCDTLDADGAANFALTVTVVGAADVLSLQADTITFDNTITGKDADITGTCNADTLDVDGAANFALTLTVDGAADVLSLQADTITFDNTITGKDADITGTCNADTLDVDGAANFALTATVEGAADVLTLQADTITCDNDVGTATLTATGAADVLTLQADTITCDNEVTAGSLDATSITGDTIYCDNTITTANLDATSVTGDTLYVDNQAKVGSLMIGGTLISSTPDSINWLVHNDGLSGAIDYLFAGGCVDGETLTITFGATLYSFEISDTLIPTCAGAPTVCMGMTILTGATCPALFAAAINGASVPANLAAKTEAGAGTDDVVTVVAVDIADSFTSTSGWANVDVSAATMHGGTIAQTIIAVPCEITVTAVQVDATNGAGGWISLCALPDNKIPLVEVCNITDSSGEVVTATNITYTFEQADSSNYYLKLSDGGGGDDLDTGDVVDCIIWASH